MSGLLAFVGARSTTPEQRAALADALEIMRHRGPSQTDIMDVSDDMVVGVNRLSTIDPLAGRQPFRYPVTGYDAERYVVAFDGDIHNYVELRDELIARHEAHFDTDSDTEVLAAAYHFWGEQAVARLRGTYAIVIVDTHRRTVWGARDPFGVRPLYHLVAREGLYLASEKKALLPFLPEPARASLDGANLSHYLTLQYVPETATLHRGIGRVGAGESFSYLPGGVFATRRYHQPQFRPTAVERPEELYREIREALRESVRLAMRADVPVGAFLSGGLDSTAVVALAREMNPDLLAFTVGYDLPGRADAARYCEIEAAQATAAQLGVRSVVTRVSPADLIAALPAIVWHCDDPVADPACVPMYFLAKKAAEHVGVVLSGDGADEVFAGNRIYREPFALSGVAALPDGVQRGLRKVAEVIPEGVRGKSFLERGTMPLEERYYGGARIFDEDDKRRLMRDYDERVRYTDVTAPYYAEASGLDDVAKMQYIDLFTWLRGNLLVRADRMSMAHSLVLRTPYLDPAVFDVAARIPLELKVPPRSDATKYALRRALDGIVPESVVNRHALGFPVPTRIWLRGELLEWAHDLLSSAGVDRLLDVGYVRGLLDEHARGERDHSRKVWTVLVFCTWYAVFVERSLKPSGAPSWTPPRPREPWDSSSPTRTEAWPA